MASTTPASRRGFHHIAMRVRDFDRSVRFYTEILGLIPKVGWGDAPKRAVMLDVGDGNYVELFERPEHAPTYDEGVLLHFAIRTQNVDAITERARGAGCQVTIEPKNVDIANNVEGEPTPIPIRISFIQGPDGEVIEFFDNELT